MPWYSPGDPTLDPTPVPAPISAPAYASDGSLLWLFGGYDATFSEIATVYTYNPDTNAWIAHADLGVAQAPSSAAAILSGYAYIISDFGFYRYTLTDGSWVALTEPPGGADWELDLVEMNGLLYWNLSDPGGGYVYDPATDAWTALTAWTTPNLPPYGPAATTDGTYIYVYAEGMLGRYDPATDSWTDLTGHGGRKVYHAVLTHLNGVLYIAGGENDTLDARVGRQPVP